MPPMSGLGSPWNWVTPDGLKKLEVGAIRPRKSFAHIFISLAIWIQYRNVTDGHQLTAKTALTCSIERKTVALQMVFIHS